MAPWRHLASVSFCLIFLCFGGVFRGGVGIKEVFGAAFVDEGGSMFLDIGRSFAFGVRSPGLGVLFEIPG